MLVRINNRYASQPIINERQSIDISRIQPKILSHLLYM